MEGGSRDFKRLYLMQEFHEYGGIIGRTEGCRSEFFI